MTSNIANGSRPSARAIPSINKLVEVPINVSNPPRIAIYESGINSFEPETPRTLAICNATGIIITTTGVLFINADAKTTKTPKAPSTNFGLSPPLEVTYLVRLDSAPVRTRAPEIINMAAIVQGAGLEKTINASLYGNIPVKIKNAAPLKDITSVG